MLWDIRGPRDELRTIGENTPMKRITLSIRSLAAAAAALTLLVGAVSAAASSTITKKMIEANYMGIKLVVDGAEVTPKDASGNVVEPFTNEGTTYLPVRAVGEALGKEVTWEGSTKTVYIGKVPGVEETWMTKLPPYQTSGKVKVYNGSDPRETFSVAGVTQTHGVTFHGGSFALWNTNNQYKTMTLTIGHEDVKGSTYNSTLEVYLDGEYSTEYELKFDAAPKTIDIDLNYAPNVKLVITQKVSGGSVDYGIYDISFS